jgi:hypothetical protein
MFSRLDGFDGPWQEIVLTPKLVGRGSGELLPRGRSEDVR